VSGHFTNTVVCDFEYEIADGDLPNVLCMVAHVLDANLQHVHTIKLWRGVPGKKLPPIEVERGDFGREPPFDIGNDTLFVAYSAWAELTCFMQLGWKFPKHIFDSHTAFLAKANILLPYSHEEKPKKVRKRLPDACRAYAIEGWELVDKDTIAADIGRGNWEKYGRDVSLSYCEEDVRMTVQLLRAQIHDRTTSVDRVLHWSNYSAKATAQIQARGMPIDMTLWNIVQENKAAVIEALIRRFDPTYGSDCPIYNLDGSTSYKQLEQGLASMGIVAWPRLDTGKLNLKGDAFRLMYSEPGIERLHALRDSLNVITKAKLPIGRDGRNRPSIFPFGTATGRNAHSKSLYNSHAGLRSFMRFPPDKIGLYLDWKAQEIGIAAALSGDKVLMEAYQDDVYYALARMCGLTTDPDSKHWKKEHPELRNRMKALQLGINYGMGASSLARGLDRHPLIATRFIEIHQRVHKPFWSWRDNEVMLALLNRRIETVFGWPLHITTSPNLRTLYNFPMQGNGSECLRLAAVELCEAGIVPSMLIHDGILFELNNEDEANLAKEIMRKAGREVCNGFEIGVDEDQRLLNGARYADKRPVAREMWSTIMNVLREIKVLP
jgi:DNA polymerase I